MWDDVGGSLFGRKSFRVMPLSEFCLVKMEIIFSGLGFGLLTCQVSARVIFLFR